jgi:hypothetical protein
MVDDLRVVSPAETALLAVYGIKGASVRDSRRPVYDSSLKTNRIQQSLPARQEAI